MGRGRVEWCRAAAAVGWRGGGGGGEGQGGGEACGRSRRMAWW